MPKTLKEKPKTEFASKEEVKELRDMLSQVLSAVQEKPVVQTNEAKVREVVEMEDAAPQAKFLPPKWRQIVTDELGEEFGVDVSYPDTGSGFILRITVPLSKSNASKAHLEYYKTDVRSKAISNSAGTEGVQKFCQQVAQNLGIKKQNK